MSSTRARLANGGASQRRAQILSKIREKGHGSVSRLSAEFQVTEMTIRRDLRQMSEEGLVELVHGGARVPSGLVPLAFAARAVDHAAAKKRLGKRTAEILADYRVVGIDAGTTTLEAALHMRPTYSGTVVTHSVPALAALTAKPSIHTIGIGGDLIPETQAMVSNTSLRMLQNIRISAVAMGANAVDPAGVYVHTALELDVKRAYLDAADYVILLVDSSKVGAPGAVRVCPLSRVDLIVTDAPLPPDVSTAAALAGASVEVC